MMDSDVDLLRISDTSNSVKQEFMFVGNHVTGPSWVVLVVVAGKGGGEGGDHGKGCCWLHAQVLP